MSTYRATVDLPPVRASARLGRHVVNELLGAWTSASADCLYDAVLLTNEVLSNAIEHVGGEACFELELTHADQWLRISVADGSSVEPVVREMNSGAQRGRGMQLVAAVASDWGFEAHHGGKRVWFDLSLS